MILGSESLSIVPTASGSSGRRVPVASINSGDKALTKGRNAAL